jgi:hypothetical protein
MDLGVTIARSLLKCGMSTADETKPTTPDDARLLEVGEIHPGRRSALEPHGKALGCCNSSGRRKSRARPARLLLPQEGRSLAGADDFLLRDGAFRLSPFPTLQVCRAASTRKKYAGRQETWKNLPPYRGKRGDLNPECFKPGTFDIADRMYVALG